MEAKQRKRIKDFLNTIVKTAIVKIVDKKFEGQKKKVAMKGIQTCSIPVVAGYSVKFIAGLFGEEISLDLAFLFGIVFNSGLQMGKNFLKHRKNKPKPMG